MRRLGRTYCGSALIYGGGGASGRGARGGLCGRGGWWEAVVTVVVAGWGLAWFGLGNADGADICGGKIAGSWDVTSAVTFPATLVMPQNGAWKWEFKSDGPQGGEAIWKDGSERKRYSCQGNTYTIEDFFGITLTLSPDGRRLNGACSDLVSAVGGGCRIYAVRKSGPPPSATESTAGGPAPLEQSLAKCMAPEKDNVPLDVQINGCTALIQSGRLTGKLLAGVLNQRAQNFFRKKDYDRAIADYTESIRLDAHDPRTFNLRASAYRNKEDYDHAIADYSEAIKLDPKVADYYDRRGLMYRVKKDFVRAYSDYNEAIRVEPKNFEPYLSRASFNSSQREFENAASDYEQALLLMETALAVKPDERLKTRIEAVRQRKTSMLQQRQMEDRWVEYLKELQSQNAYPNWSGPPYDLYLTNREHRVSPQ